MSYPFDLFSRLKYPIDVAILYRAITLTQNAKSGLKWTFSTLANLLQGNTLAQIAQNGLFCTGTIFRISRFEIVEIFERLRFWALEIFKI